MGAGGWGPSGGFPTDSAQASVSSSGGQTFLSVRPEVGSGERTDRNVCPPGPGCAASYATRSKTALGVLHCARPRGRGFVSHATPVAHRVSRPASCTVQDRAGVAFVAHGPQLEMRPAGRGKVFVRRYAVITACARTSGARCALPRPPSTGVSTRSGPRAGFVSHATPVAHRGPRPESCTVQDRAGVASFRTRLSWHIGSHVPSLAQCKTARGVASYAPGVAHRVSRPESCTVQDRAGGSGQEAARIGGFGSRWRLNVRERSGPSLIIVAIVPSVPEISPGRRALCRRWLENCVKIGEEAPFFRPVICRSELHSLPWYD